MIITFTVPGKPQGWKRPGRGWHGKRYNASAGYERQIANAFRVKCKWRDSRWQVKLNREIRNRGKAKLPDSGKDLNIKSLEEAIREMERADTESPIFVKPTHILLSGYWFTWLYKGAVRLYWTAHFPPPASWSKKRRAAVIGKPRLKTPDADNILKVICDALNKLAWHDDRQVIPMRLERVYGIEARLEIEIHYEGV